MPNGLDLIYFANNHLSSASLVMDDSGTLQSGNRYMPFGEVRTISGVTNISKTDFGYTGQRNNSDIGLMDYSARYYSPYLNRFIQPDTIVPNMSNPQSLNRFTYTSNNPINRIDPTGHDDLCEGFPAGHPESCECVDDPVGCELREKRALLISQYGIEISFSGMTDAEMLQFVAELLHIISKAGPEFIDKYLRGTNYKVKSAEMKEGKCGYHRSGKIGMRYGNADCNYSGTALHETIHVIDFRSGWELSKGMMNYVGASYEKENWLGNLSILLGFKDPTYKVGPEHAPSYGSKGMRYPLNHREDLAESVEEYFGFGNIRIKEDEKRSEFIYHLLTTGEILTP